MASKGKLNRAHRRSWRDKLSSLRARRAQAYFHMFVVHIYYPMRRIYNRRYGAATPDPAVEVVGNDDADDSRQPQRREADKRKSSGTVWYWKDLPKIWPFLTWYRWASSIWMFYVIFKYTAPGLLESAVDQLNLAKPARCYLLGRFILVDGVERVTAIFFAGYHLVWRYFQLIKYNPDNIGGVYFLILDDRDIPQYYKLLAKQNTASRQLAKLSSSSGGGGGGGRTQHEPWASLVDDSCQCGNRGGARVVAGAVESRGVDRFMHDVMSYPVFLGAKRLNRLKPNRTPEARRDLTNYMITANLCGIFILGPVALAIALALAAQVFNDNRYLDDYHMCSEDAEQMRARGELTKWSVHFSPDQVLAYTMDFLENFFLWFESGLVLFFSPILNLFITRDLLIYWAHLDAKITACLKAVRRSKESNTWRLLRAGDVTLTGGAPQQHAAEHAQLNVSARGYFGSSSSPGVASILHTTTTHQTTTNVYKRFSLNPLAPFLLKDENNELDETILDIQFEFQDLIRNIKQGDHFIGDLLSILLTVWFSLLAYFTYMQQTDLLLALKATLIFVGLILTALYIGILQLHRNCLKSYPKICSLMALADSKYTKNFTYIIDYYVRKQTCYTFYRRVPMTGIQYLTYVGYSLSCLFLVLNRR